MQRTVPIFVSSTFDDLQPYREAVRDVLHRLEAVVRGMEYFGALPETPKDECLRIVRDCQYCVCVIGMRYGSLDPATGKSFTHLEYEEAQRRKLPTLIYLLDEERQPVLPKHIDFDEAGEKLRDFKRTLKANHVVSFFTSPEDLAVRVSQDVPALVERTGTVVHRGELANLVESLPRVTWLTPERFAFLKKEIGEAAAVVSSDQLLKELMEFLISGDRLAAVFLLSRRARLDLRDSTDALMEIETRIFGVLKRGMRLIHEKQSADSTTISPNNLNDATEYTVAAVTPASLSDTEREEVMTLVREGEEVGDAVLDKNVRAAQCLALARAGARLVGVAALKNPQESYRNTIHTKSGITIDVGTFPFEFGYLFVQSDARKHGLAMRLSDAALAVAGEKGVFATARTNNDGMYVILPKLGFVKAGNPYKGRGDYEIQLYIRHAAQQSVAADAPQASRR